MYYFAYGSNMDPSEIRSVSPNARFISIARLPGYRLDFTRYSTKRGGGVADIVEDDAAVVRGVLYDVPQRELSGLDKKEGVKKGYYQRIKVKVFDSFGAPILALTYSVVDKQSTIPPSESYLDVLLRGAKHWGLPDEYVQSTACISKAANSSVLGHDYKASSSRPHPRSASSPGGLSGSAIPENWNQHVAVVNGDIVALAWAVRDDTILADTVSWTRPSERDFESGRRIKSDETIYPQKVRSKNSEFAVQQILAGSETARFSSIEVSQADVKGSSRPRD